MTLNVKGEFTKYLTGMGVVHLALGVWVGWRGQGEWGTADCKDGWWEGVWVVVYLSLLRETWF